MAQLDNRRVQAFAEPRQRIPTPPHIPLDCHRYLAAALRLAWKLSNEAAASMSTSVSAMSMPASLTTLDLIEREIENFESLGMEFVPLSAKEDGDGVVLNIASPSLATAIVSFESLRFLAMIIDA